MILLFVRASFHFFGTTKNLHHLVNIYIEKRVDSEIDSVQHILNLVVIPTDFVMVEDSIYNGMSYEWNGVEYDTSGDYIDTLVNIYGCDSIVILRLRVIDNIVTINDILAVDQCADANVVELIVDYSGFVDSVALHFPQDTIDSISFGFYDVKVPMPVDGHIVVAYPSIRAGKYNTLVLGENYFHAPHAAGIYMAKIILLTGEERNVKLLVM